MTDQPRPTASRVLKNYNFRLLWIGQGTSLLGDQFFMIALPWLVLKLTNDPLALGTVLAMIGIPRALFMLVGGAFADRYSPRAIMLASDVLRLLLTILLTILILASWLQLWMLYLLAVFFGVISGFFVPASGAMMPVLVQPEELPVSNSIYQGTAYMTNFVGPVLAGGLIALFGHAATAQTNAEITGIAAAIAVDAFSFLASVATLVLMKWQSLLKPPSRSAGNIFSSIREGIGYVWHDELLRTVFILMVGANFLFNGPLLVGIPVLADSRLSGGAAAFGTIMGALGGGNMLGILVSNTVLQVMGKHMGVFMVGVIAAFGIGLGLIGVVSSTPVVFLILLVLGTGNGVLSITLITFLQRQTPAELLGRVMSLVMLAGVGLVPISQALTGAFIKLNLTGLFIGAGIMMLLVAMWLVFQPAIRSISNLLTAKI